jgi:hypothetical protein
MLTDDSCACQLRMARFPVVIGALLLAVVVPYVWALVRHRHTPGLVMNVSEGLDLYQRAFLAGAPEMVTLRAPG